MKAEYIDHMGDDNRVVDAARVSFDKIADNYSPEQNNKLINYLARHGHWTPFSHPQITVRETVPIFVARQRLKHFVGFTYNEVSRRYVDDLPEFYYPETWRSRPDGSVKQGSSDIPVQDVINHADGSVLRTETRYELFVEEAKALYTDMLMAGVAPEQARMVLPQSMYTSYYVTGSLAAWARAYKQRSDRHSQKEIQDLSLQWDKIIRPLYPVSWTALTQ